MNSTENHKTDFNILIVNYLNQTISEDEMILLMHWIKSDDRNKAHFITIKDAWMLADSGKVNEEPDAESAWKQLHHKLDQDHPQELIPYKSGSFYRYLRIAATWLVFFTVGSILTYLFTGRKTIADSKPVSITIPLGAMGNITLPDGSKVWLNAGTTLTYHQDYGSQERKLHLTGEAYFDVSKDKSHPFIVETSEIIVRALGTRFNVKAYPDEKTISATLEEGVIDVRLIDANSENKKVLLEPKEKIVYFKVLKETEKYTESADEKVITQELPKSGIPVKLKDVNILTGVNTQLYTSWKDPRWIVEGEQLGTLAPMLERKYNMKIIFENDELKKYKFTGTFENETIDQILNALKLSAPVDYKINKDIIKLTLNTNYEEEFGRIMTRNN